MKLKELIEKLQKAEKANPGMEVRFQNAESNGNGHIHSERFLLAIQPEPGENMCFVTVGDARVNAKEYQENLEIMREQERRFNR